MLNSYLADRCICKPNFGKGVQRIAMNSNTSDCLPLCFAHMSVPDDQSGLGRSARPKLAELVGSRYHAVMPRRPRWTEEPHADGVQVFHLDAWGYFDDFVRQQMLDARSYIWRGQAAAKWPLESTLDRLLRRIGKLNDPRIRDNHLKNFKYSARGRRGPNPALINSDNDWWALGQHYGLATPLLDWSTSPFVAAYFAYVAEDNDQDARRAVYALGRYSVTAKSEDVNSKWLKQGRAPIIEFVEPLSDENTRLVNQGGLFTRAPDAVTIEDWIRQHFRGDNQVCRLLKVTFPSKDRPVALQTLNRMNINHLSLFPDLYGASKFANVALLIENY